MDIPVGSKINWVPHDSDVSPSDMTWFSFNSLYYMLALIAAAKILEDFVFPRCLPNYHEHSLRTIRNLVTYVLEVPVTSFCFYIQVTSGVKVIMEKYTTYDAEMCRLSLFVLSCLYLFELMYRLDMNFQLTVHHVLTLVLTICNIQAVHETKDGKFYNGGMWFLAMATTEQLSFIALFMYRIKHRYAGYALRFSALQTLLCKTLFMVALLQDVCPFLWGPNALNPHGTIWYYRWRILIGIITPSLYATQGYGAWVLWKLGLPKRINSDSPRKDDDRKVMEEKKMAEMAQIPVVRHLKHA